MSIRLDVSNCSKSWVSVVAGEIRPLLSLRKHIFAAGRGYVLEIPSRKRMAKIAPNISKFLPAPDFHSFAASWKTGNDGIQEPCRKGTILNYQEKTSRKVSNHLKYLLSIKTDFKSLSRTCSRGLLYPRA